MSTPAVTSRSSQANMAVKPQQMTLLLLAATLVMGIITACGSTQAAAVAAPVNQPKAVRVRVAPAASGSIAISAAYAATVEARDLVNLVPVAPGRIEKLEVEIGSEVRKGQVIAELSHGPLDLELQSEEAALREAEADLAGLQTLVTIREANARVQLDAARTKLEQLLHPSASDLKISSSEVEAARSQLNRARTKLSQLQNPIEADLAEARKEVAEAKSDLFAAQEEVTDKITKYLEGQIPAGDDGRKWQVLLPAQQGLHSSRAKLLLRQTLDWDLSPTEVANYGQIVAINRRAVQSLLEELIVPADITGAILAEEEAAVALDSARATLAELQSPTQSAIDLAQQEVNEAQAELEAAEAKLSLLKNPNPAALAAAQAEVAKAVEAVALTEMPYAHYDLEAARARVDRAVIEVDLVRRQLADLKVLAPFDGFVTRRWLATGSMASNQSPIVTVASKEAVVSLRIQETDITSLQIGQNVSFTTPALPGQRQDLVVGQIAPTGDERAHTFSVLMYQLEAQQNLKPGMSGQVSVVTNQDNATLVPKVAIVYQDGQPFLFTVHDGTARLRKVDVGFIDQSNIQIRSGVQPGEQIVVSGHGLLSEGDLVTIEEASSERPRRSS